MPCPFELVFSPRLGVILPVVESSMRGSVKSTRRPLHSDVLALAWPESPSFGLALGGFGLRKS